MGLKDIIDKSRKKHTIGLHGTQISFCELGYEEEARAREVGIARAKNTFDKPSDEVKNQYGVLYVYLEMIRAGGEAIHDDDFFAMSSEYHSEVMMAINVKLNSDVHTEGRRLEQQLRKRLHDMTLGVDEEEEKVLQEAADLKKALAE